MARVCIDLSSIFAMHAKASEQRDHQVFELPKTPSRFDSTVRTCLRMLFDV